MKKTIFVLVSIIIICFLSVSVSAHSGGTDSNGGHYDRETGIYHYHHGYSAHQHPNGVCPYSKDKQEQGSESKTEHEYTHEIEPTTPEYSLWSIVGSAIVVSLFILSLSVVYRDKLNLPENLSLFVTNALCSNVIYSNNRLASSADYGSDNSAIFKSILKQDDECTTKLREYEERRKFLQSQYNDDFSNIVAKLKNLALFLVPGLVLGSIVLGNIMLSYISIVKNNYLSSSLVSLGVLLCIYCSILACYYRVKTDALKKYYYNKNSALDSAIETSFDYSRQTIKDIISEHRINTIAGVPDGFEIVDGYPIDDNDTYARYVTGYTGRCYHEKKGCSTSCIKMNEFECQMRGFVNCSKCATWHNPPVWLNRYWHIESILEKYDIDINELPRLNNKSNAKMRLKRRRKPEFPDVTSSLSFLPPPNSSTKDILTIEEHGNYDSGIDKKSIMIPLLAAIVVAIIMLLTTVFTK